MQYFLHAPYARKTHLIKLEVESTTFHQLVRDYLDNNIRIVPATVQTAHVHPKDNYSKKIGRQVARLAPETVALFEIASINITPGEVKIKLRLTYGETEYSNLDLIKYKDSGKVAIFSIDKYSFLY